MVTLVLYYRLGVEGADLDSDSDGTETDGEDEESKQGEVGSSSVLVEVQLGSAGSSSSSDEGLEPHTLETGAGPSSLQSTGISSSVASLQTSQHLQGQTEESQEAVEKPGDSSGTDQEVGQEGSTSRDPGSQPENKKDVSEVSCHYKR